MENLRNMFAGFGKRDVTDLKNKNKQRSMSLSEDSTDTLPYENKFARIRSVSECSTTSVDEQTLAHLTQHAQNAQAAGNQMEKEAYFWIM